MVQKTRAFFAVGGAFRQSRGVARKAAASATPGQFCGHSLQREKRLLRAIKFMRFARFYRRIPGPFIAFEHVSDLNCGRPNDRPARAKSITWKINHL
jgi:hypothetical protein